MSDRPTLSKHPAPGAVHSIRDRTWPAWCGLALSVIASVASAAFARTTFHEYRDAVRWYQQALDVLGELEALDAAALSARSSARGYAMSGQERQAARFDEALPQAVAQVARIRTFTESNSPLQTSLDQFEPVFNQFCRVASGIVEARRGGATPNELALRSEALTDASDALIGASQAMQAEERHTLRARAGEAEKAARWLGSAVAACATAGTGLACASGFWVFRAMRRARRARDAAEDASRAKGEFLANVSHELRTPLNGIIGMTDLTLGGELPPDQRDRLLLVRESAGTLLTLVNDLLDLAKIEAGRLDLAPVRFELHRVVGRALRLLAERARNKGLVLRCAIAPEVPTEAVGDPDRLVQILTNLVSNAIKFTENGEVVIHVRAAERSAGGLAVAFEVADTGIGIPADRLEKIFRPFEQADGSTTRKYGGTGLGLSIVDRLTRMMGGRVTVASQPGRGSTFTATVRLGAVSSETILLPPASVTGVRVLVVKPPGPGRDTLTRLLAGWAMRPETEDTPAEAVARLAAGGFGLVVVSEDQTGGPGGAERVVTAAAGVPVLVVHWGAPRRGAARACAALARPYTPSDLFDAVMAALTPSVATAPAEPEPEPAPPVPGRRLRLLLAEDNRINQRVAQELLGRVGHTVVSVADGAEAVAAWEAGAFDAVLMDVQMPVMGGFEATAAIRARERERRGRRTPIVAMTARAMAGDEDECRAAGMDAYVPKPLNPGHLMKILAELVPDESAPPPPAEPVCDLEWLPADIRHEIAALFITEAPGDLAAVRTAVAGGDAAQLVRAAHRLAGSLESLRAGPNLAIARRLQVMGKSKDLTGATAALTELEVELDRLTVVLRALVCAPTALAANGT
ncbi:Signal transduction histidine-protein kinase BarA [Gemmata obscuriglobus]|uniref:Sensory/regulatory protein RpfC n=1 Tax=Gemmata obscuriglobus TaxID=114 RepID=A0A2Z3H4D1_9BACT|nr:ATP-binding protein [Gemmata obscuriglobus]AWM39192.1 hybrid sensor histidine kinase/response regulator [Gemmata obscuriglobus]QEG27758.1 Signal transduction histidine-protein kinase BarA [Gemmata obscuriglobus]VTS05042.1 histidine kinase : Histidine kinase OS=Singulisphaera acidiphila (strain ATCC BAA-1392 / DSM 18658 / VKM B-2454 / MOB10) GN=Sinac_7402 PE=4 SV=1: CHASE3: HisKA: HATPase_c: Response_reg: Hpt [Gemmata obscuriglobus UQM 2246]